MVGDDSMDSIYGYFRSLTIKVLYNLNYSSGMGHTRLQLMCWIRLVNTRRSITALLSLGRGGGDERKCDKEYESNGKYGDYPWIYSYAQICHSSGSMFISVHEAE